MAIYLMPEGVQHLRVSVYIKQTPICCVIYNKYIFHSVLAH